MTRVRPLTLGTVSSPLHRPSCVGESEEGLDVLSGGSLRYAITMPSVSEGFRSGAVSSMKR